LNRRLWPLLALIVTLIAGTTLDAESADDPGKHPWYVFHQRSTDSIPLDRLIFLDMLTGQEIAVRVDGERYSAIRDAVLYFDRTEQQVMLATPDGERRPHPFIRLAPGERRVDWVIAPDGRTIAWTVTRTDPTGRLVTATYVGSSTSDIRLLLEDGPYDVDIRALPVAFSEDLSQLFMDYHPDGVSQFIVYDQYASIFAVDLESGATRLMPDEPANCICGAALARDRFLRMRLTSDLDGFDLHVYGIGGSLGQKIPAIRLDRYDTGGDIVISPDGRQAIYALTRLDGGGSAELATRSAVVLVDLEMLTQSVLVDSITTFVRPVEWTEDNSAVIFTSPMQDGTWKINLRDRRLERIASATYIGVLRRER
jgi:hypothetical protein